MNQHLIIAPILIPFVAGALMLLYDDRQRVVKFWISLSSILAQLFIAIQLVIRAKTGAETGGEGITFYLLGNWEAPMGIVLVLDRLSAMMLVLTAFLATVSLIYARAGWHRQGTYFYSLFQFLLVGLNGAFLTGDLFNLFVFFEVLLAASYGLLLHGSGQVRVRAGFHYIAINLTASLLFLIGVSLIYGVTGTLNMAHLANMISQVAPADRPLLHAAFAILGVAFLVKAGSWPLSFWLPSTYMAAAAPIGAMFAIMTKVGIYAILRLSLLMFGTTGGPSAGFGASVLIALGMATMIFGLLGILAAQNIGRIAANTVLISSGSLLIVIGFALLGGGEAMLAGALYYMIGSTLATGALFLLVEPMERKDGGIAALLALTADAYGMDAQPVEDDSVTEGPRIGYGLPLLAGGFIVAVLFLAGLPPLPGFIGKVAMIQGLIAVTGIWGAIAWGSIALLLLSGLAALIGLVRIGIQTFWTNEENPSQLMALEIAPVLALAAALCMMTVKAEATLRYTAGTAVALHETSAYAYGVFAARPAVTNTSAKTDGQP
ncbi:monovalent cation/H+ antiporter subunit D [Paracoccus onubensis]|uniref:Monovalent cation/H+ antiporter subunit D n=1 Tax=Paracoccus onubensis TaxID=1675788 RepID=A0A418T4U0_9RHOB|nr:monovalent cation/H+ antiporter subunit D [Paracoccus onubensis]RJE88215.1 monovalent cation/H+ antiporter subunit D [Paracoccus onubensis]